MSNIPLAVFQVTKFMAYIITLSGPYLWCPSTAIPISVNRSLLILIELVALNIKLFTRADT